MRALWLFIAFAGEPGVPSDPSHVSGSSHNHLAEVLLPEQEKQPHEKQPDEEQDRQTTADANDSI